MIPSCIVGGRLPICCLLLSIVSSLPLHFPTVQVNGILGESVSLSVNINLLKTVSKTKWYYEPQTSEGEKIMIAEFFEGELKRPNFSDRFGQRLEGVSQTTLQITPLQMDDRGIYTADMRFDTAETQTYQFVLTVNEPAPKLQLPSNTSQGHKASDKCDIRCIFFYVQFAAILAFGIISLCAYGCRGTKRVFLSRKHSTVICWKKMWWPFSKIRGSHRENEKQFA